MVENCICRNECFDGDLLCDSVDRKLDLLYKYNVKSVSGRSSRDHGQMILLYRLVNNDIGIDFADFFIITFGQLAILY